MKVELELSGWDKHFYTERGGGLTFYVKDIGDDDDIDGEEVDMHEESLAHFGCFRGLK